jgi:hypothetical protein
VGDWYWIGLLVGLGAAIGVLFAGALAGSRMGIVLAVILAAGGGLLAGLGIGEWDEAIGGAIGGPLGVAGTAQLVQGTLRRGGGQAATAVWIALAAVVVGALALVPGVGYLEGVALPVLGARLRGRAPQKYAGLRSLAK